jgi:hypothetical protein
MKSLISSLFLYLWKNTAILTKIRRKDGDLLAFAALMLFTIMGLGIDLDEYLQHEYLDIPRWYFYIIFSIDALMMMGLVLMFFYKK